MPSAQGVPGWRSQSGSGNEGDNQVEDPKEITTNYEDTKHVNEVG